MAKYKLLNINTNKVDEFDTAEEALSATRAGFFGEKTHTFLPDWMYDTLDESAVKNSDYANSINSMRGDMLNSMDNGRC